MKIFQQAHGTITIINNTHQVTMPLSSFQAFEPGYVPASLPVRIWSEQRACLSDGWGDYPDPDYSQQQHDNYCASIETYQSLLDLEPPKEPEAPPTREQRLKMLNDDLHAYLNGRGYDTGTQLSFQAIYIDLLGLPTLNEHQESAQAQIRQAWDFVRGVVLAHYYVWKAELEAIENFAGYQWDYTQLDPADPCVSLRSILLLLSS